MRVDKRELTRESLHESFIHFHCLIKREQERMRVDKRELTRESWQERVYMRVSSTFIAWSNENKREWELTRESWQERVYMRVSSTFIAWSNENKREWELTRESWQERVYMRVSSTFIAWSNENKSCMRVDKQELTSKSWQERVYVRVSSTFIAPSNENKSCMRVDKQEFTWEFHQLSLLDQTRTRVAWELKRGSLYRVSSTFIAWLKEKKIWMRASWQLVGVYIRVPPTFIAWSKENNNCMRVERERESLHESFINFHCVIKREQELHESWQERVYMRVPPTFIAWSKENNNCMRVEEREREFTWEFHQLSLRDQTRTRVAWELTSESLHENFVNFHCLIKREQELHESWQARVYMRISSTFIAWSNENKSCITCMRADKREFTWEFRQLSLLDQTRTRVAWELTSESLHESFINRNNNNTRAHYATNRDA